MIRVVTGAILLIHGWDWITEGGFDGGVIRASVEATLVTSSSSITWWGERVLLQNPDAFAFFWRWGALFV